MADKPRGPPLLARSSRLKLLQARVPPSCSVITSRAVDRTPIQPVPCQPTASTRPRRLACELASEFPFHGPGLPDNIPPPNTQHTPRPLRDTRSHDGNIQQPAQAVAHLPATPPSSQNRVISLRARTIGGPRLWEGRLVTPAPKGTTLTASCVPLVSHRTNRFWVFFFPPPHEGMPAGTVVAYK